MSFMSAAVARPKIFESGPIAIVGGGSATMAHGLSGVTPSSKFAVTLNLECVTAYGGWLAGEFLPMNVASTLSGTGAQGSALKWGSSNFYLKFGASIYPFQFIAFGTGGRISPPAANFKFHITAELIG